MKVHTEILIKYRHLLILKGQVDETTYNVRSFGKA